MKQILLLLIIVLFINCNDDKKNSVDTLSNIDSTISTIKTPEGIKVDTSKKTSDSNIIKQINKLGGYKVKTEFSDPNKCNLYKGIYILKKPVLDSALLIRFLDCLSKQLYSKNVTYSDCKYSKMVLVDLFMSKKDYDSSLHIGSSSIEPNGSHSFINDFVFSEYKKYGHVKY